MLLSTTKGIFISNDGGVKWTQIYNGNVINKAEFSPNKNGVIVATSNYMDGSGDGYAYPPSQVRIIYSKDFGQSWSEVSPSGLGYLFSESAAIDFIENDKADIYFSTSDLGLVKYQISLETLSSNSNNMSKSDIIVYPNPTSDYINISSDQVKEITVLDFTGKILFKSASKKVNLFNLPSGVYVLKATLNNGKSISKKIIKN